MKIINARIRPLPKFVLDTMANVIATFEDGSAKTLFSFYPDEISFDAAELIGLTETEALELHHHKDSSFLQLCASQLRPMARKPRVAAARQLQAR